MTEIAKIKPNSEVKLQFVLWKDFYTSLLIKTIWKFTRELIINSKNWGSVCTASQCDTKIAIFEIYEFLNIDWPGGRFQILPDIYSNY